MRLLKRSERCEASSPTRPARGVVDTVSRPASWPTNTVKAAVVNGWDVRPTLERISRLLSSGRIVRNRLITAPGPDRCPPAAYLRASTEHAGHPVVASTAAFGGRLAVAQPTTTPFTGLVRAPEPVGDMPPRHIPRRTSLPAHSTACRAVWLYWRGFLNLVQPPQVAAASRSKLAPNPRSVSLSC